MEELKRIIDDLNLEGVSEKTWITIIAAAIGVINAIVAMLGFGKIEISPEVIYKCVSSIFLAASVVYGCWHNNSVTAGAQQADDYHEDIKENKSEDLDVFELAKLDEEEPDLTDPEVMQITNAK